MSKAFTSEETPEVPDLVVPRAPLPAGVPNYVTCRGLALLRDELEALRSEPSSPALAQRRLALEQRIASAELVRIPTESLEIVRFGATVGVVGDSGERSYQIVGVDEADPARGRVAFSSPLARALLGHGLGDVVRLQAPRGDEELEITSVRYAG